MSLRPRPSDAPSLQGCCAPWLRLQRIWRLWRATRDSTLLVQRVTAALATAPEPPEGKPPAPPALPVPTPPYEDNDEDDEALRRVTEALRQHGVDLDDVAELAALAGVTDVAALAEIALEPTWEPAPSPAELPDVPKAEMVVLDNTLHMSDHSPIGTALTRAGTKDVYTLRKDTQPLPSDPWYRKVMGVKRAYLLGAQGAVLAACSLDVTRSSVLPERPLLPIARTPAGPVHPLSPEVRRAVFFLLEG